MVPFFEAFSHHVQGRNQILVDNGKRLFSFRSVRVFCQWGRLLPVEAFFNGISLNVILEPADAAGQLQAGFHTGGYKPSQLLSKFINAQKE